MTDNIWRQNRDILTNPYHETAFKAAGVIRSASSDEIDAALQRRLRILNRLPGHLKLGSRDLEEIDLTNAHTILLGTTLRRILEELLEHQPETLPNERLVRLQERLEKIAPSGPPPAFDAREFALRCAQQVAVEALDQLPSTDIPPFPMDIELIPPFDTNKKFERLPQPESQEE